MLGIALARITVPGTNLTSPYRPHAERQHLAPGLVLVAILDKVAALSPAVTGFLLCAAGAALMDRVAESFAGRRALRAEIMMLGGSSALAGLGLLLAGAARLGAPWGEIAGLHVAFMGGLGLGVYAVFSIAGLLHTGRPLGIAPWTRAGAGLLCASVVLRIAPEFGFAVEGAVQASAALAWASAFLIWLCVDWPYLSSAGAKPETRKQDAERAHRSSEMRQAAE